MNRYDTNNNLDSFEDVYDHDKKLIEMMQNIINEDDNQSSLPNVDVPASQSEQLDPQSLQQEEKAFMETVSPKVEFRMFNIYRKERNVVFSGKFQDLSGLEFVMSLKDDNGLSVTVSNLKLTNDVMSTLNKLQGYYTNWSKNWATKINNEYRYNTM